MTNPNGDPDDENRPRMDYYSKRNLVSDVRLKRYIRDYLQDKGYKIYVENPEDGKVVDANTRVKNLLGHVAAPQDKNFLMKELIDIRLFGGTIPIKKGEGDKKGDSIKVTGPIQISWGYSLNEADLMDTYSITSRFSSGEGMKQGTIGKDYRVYYSIIGFYGTLSGHRAEATGLTNDDMATFEQALIKSIPQQSTRSKIGQYPRLYIKLQYKDKESSIGDLREYVELKNRFNLRSVKDVSLCLDNLFLKISNIKQLLDKVTVWQDPMININLNDRKINVFEEFRQTGINAELLNT